LRHAATAQQHQTTEVSYRLPSPARSPLKVSTTQSLHPNSNVLIVSVQSSSNDRFQAGTSPQSKLTFSDEFIIAAINPKIPSKAPASDVISFPPQQIPRPALFTREEFASPSPAQQPLFDEHQDPPRRKVEDAGRGGPVKSERDSSGQGRKVSVKNREDVGRNLKPLTVLEGLPDDLWSSDGPIPKRSPPRAREGEQTEEEEEEEGWVQPIVSVSKQEQTRGRNQEYSDTDF
jgi:hypothetical protein